MKDGNMTPQNSEENNAKRVQVKFYFIWNFVLLNIFIKILQNVFLSVNYD